MDQPARRSRPRKGPKGPTTNDPIELALEAGVDPASTLGLIKRQTVLIDEQIGLARNERFRNRIKAVRDAALTAAVVGLIFAAGWMAWDASHADGVVIEPFTVDPALARPDLTGPQLAHRLLIRLSGMEAHTPSLRRGKSARDSSDDITVEIPATGVSLGEVLRLLRRRLGHETVVSGELTKADDGTLTLVVRIDGAPYNLPGPGQPPATSVEALIDQAAEGLFERTDTYRYAAWLNNTPGRLADSERQFNSLSLRGSAEDRAWAYSALSVQARTKGEIAQAIRLAREAIRLDPELPNAQSNLQVACDTIDNLQCVLESNRRILALVGAKRDPYSQGFRLEARIADATYGRDPLALSRAADEAVAAANSDVPAYLAQTVKAAAFVALHQVSDARAVLAQLPSLPPGHPNRKLDALALQQTLEDWPALEAEARAPSPDLTAAGPEIQAAFSELLSDILAYVLARQNRTAEAKTVLAALPSPPSSCYSCLELRGQIAAYSRDWAASDRWFAAATTAGPDVPLAWLHWGEAEAARGDLARARTLIDKAAKIAPRWADPLKAKGDLLMRRGDPRGAMAAYRDAARFAPHWGGLQAAWARALDEAGQKDQAMKHWRLAAGMDLSAADRAAVRGRLAAKS